MIARTTAALAFAIVIGAASASGDAEPPATTSAADGALDKAIAQFVESTGGSPGVAVVVQRRADLRLHAAGARKLSDDAPPPRLGDYMRVASVAKAFSGATALALVAEGRLSLRDTIGELLPELPVAWWDVSLRQLLGHTSGIPDFSRTGAFQKGVVASLDSPPSPIELLSYVFDKPLLFPPGSEYRYSNSDNITVGLMVEATTDRSYRRQLARQVARPLGLGRTSLPRGTALGTPAIHGYALDPPDEPEDVTELIAAGWSWASGGVVSTPRDLNRFVRGYVRGATTDRGTRRRQFSFVRGGRSEPRGPGANAAGLALFRYRTACGTVFGHTGNTAGYTQFMSATRNGRRSATVSINAQITPREDEERFRDLRHIFKLAVCAALAGRA